MGRKPVDQPPATATHSCRPSAAHPTTSIPEESLRLFQRRLALATAAPCQLATGADYRFRAAEGPPQGRVGRLAGRYLDAVIRAATRQPWVRRRPAEVLHLLRPPAALFGPGVLARLAWDRLAGRVSADSRLGGPVREGTDAVRGRRGGVEAVPEWTAEEGSRA